MSKGQAARSRLPWILGIFLATFPLFYRGIIQYPHAVIRSFDRLSNTTDIVHAQLATPSATLSWSTWSNAPSPAPTCALPYLLHPSLPLGPTCMEGRCSLWDSLPCVWSSGVVAVEIEEPAAAVNATAEDAGGPRPLQHVSAENGCCSLLSSPPTLVRPFPSFLPLPSDLRFPCNAAVPGNDRSFHRFHSNISIRRWSDFCAILPCHGVLWRLCRLCSIPPSVSVSLRILRSHCCNDVCCCRVCRCHT